MEFCEECFMEMDLCRKCCEQAACEDCEDGICTSCYLKMDCEDDDDRGIDEGYDCGGSLETPESLRYDREGGRLRATKRTGALPALLVDEETIKAHDKQAQRIGLVDLSPSQHHLPTPALLAARQQPDPTPALTARYEETLERLRAALVAAAHVGGPMERSWPMADKEQAR